MLTAAEQREIEQHLRRYPSAQAACIEALKVIQRRHGWVSDLHLADVAALLDMSTAELDSVATFYNLIFREPVGRHVILLCDSVSCWITGYHAVRAQLERRLQLRLGETSGDGRFTLLPMVCLGACDRAPAMMVDEDLHGPLTPESLDVVLEGYK